MKRFRRRYIEYIILLMCLLGVSYFLWHENNTIEITEYSITIENMPDAFEGYKILQISDLQCKKFSNENKALIQLIDKSSPDIIVITGDLFDRRKMDTAQNSFDFIDQIVNKYPIYFASGNHESWSGSYNTIVSILKDKGVIVLDNESTMITKNNDKIKLLGLVDPSYYYPENGRTFESYIGYIQVDRELELLMQDVEDTAIILLSHRPELVDIYMQYDIDLVLSGHSHGGQIQLPLIGGLWAPNQGLLPEYDGGCYELSEENSMIVSRGLGNSSFPFRINNRPELVEITLSRK